MPQDPRRLLTFEEARALAVRLLARRDFGTAELTEKLQQDGIAASLAASVIAGLIEDRVMSDARYAENYVRKHSGRGQGPVRIQAELRALGLAEDVIDAALAGGPDWRLRALEVLAAKFGAERPTNRAEQARRARFLQYRGFSSDHIRSAVGGDFDPD